jgi:hypothetical protein
MGCCPRRPTYWRRRIDCAARVQEQSRYGVRVLQAGAIMAQARVGIKVAVIVIILLKMHVCFIRRCLSSSCCWLQVGSQWCWPGRSWWSDVADAFPIELIFQP